MKELEARLEDLEDYLERIKELHAVFNPENQKDFVIDRILQYVYDFLRISKDILEALKENDEKLANEMKWIQDDFREFARKVAKKIAEGLKEEEE